MTQDQAVCAQITTAPSESAPLVLDINNRKPMYVLHNGFSLGSSDGGERRVQLTVRLRGADGSVPQAISALMRAINRREAYFQWQAHSRHEPTWFKILGAVSEMSFDSTVVNDSTRDPIWEIAVSLTVEEFSYGERVTLPPMTVTNAALGYAIPYDIEGDAPTAATIAITPPVATGWGGWENLLNVIAVDESCPLGAPGAPGEEAASVLPAVITWQAEAFTRKGDATATSSASYSGGSAVLIPESNTTWREVLSGNVPVEVPPGRYAVFLRCSRSSSSGRMRFRAGHDGWDAILNNDAPLYAPLVGAADSAWLPLGTMSFPAGQKFTSLTGDEMTTPVITLRAQGLNSGPTSSNIAVDRFALVPIELAEGGIARTMRAKWRVNGPLGVTAGLWNSWKVDGFHRRNGLVAFNDNWYASILPPQAQGGFPVLHPGQRNIVTVLPKVHNSTGGGVGVEAVASSITIAVSYSPRFRHLAGS